MNDTWESDIAALLSELSDVQTAILDALREKRTLLAKRDDEALLPMAEREQLLIERLQACRDRRQELLDRAQSAGLPADSIRSLCGALSVDSCDRMQDSIASAAERSRFLQHESLVNWVVTQQTLLHLSQMIEIIATGGRFQPTYGSGGDSRAGGALVDQAV